MCKDASPPFFVSVWQVLARSVVLITDEFREPRPSFTHRQDEISNARGDGAARHRSVFRLTRVLHENNAAGFLDRPDANRPVGAGTGQNNRETISMLICQGAKEEIDGRSLPARLIEFNR